MSTPYGREDLAKAARSLVLDQMVVTPGEQVLITADTASDMTAVEALREVADGAGAATSVLVMKQLPHQGTLADPYIAEPVAAAVRSCDVWIDLTLPYLTGSRLHEGALEENRVRSLMAAGVDATALVRLYGHTDLDRVFDLQAALDEIIAAGTGTECRIKSRTGTDVTFVLAAPAFKKPRRAEKPGSYNAPGSAVMFPEPDSVRGRIMIDSAFHEYYSVFNVPMALIVDGRVKGIEGEEADCNRMDRAIRRAADGAYGYIIHFTCGIQAAAQFDGATFLEATRSVGSNAIGIGIPSWVPGEGGGNRGENHPDGILRDQSLWIDGQQITEDGRIRGPKALQGLAERIGASG